MDYLNNMGFAKPPANTRIIVAMSGGVDSSTVAAMLVENGYDVIGLTMQLYDHGEAISRKGSCCAGQDILDAREVAARLNIPHYVLDYENRFRETVIDEFADSYLRGETPIPCIRCNQTVKFHDMLKMAKDLGGDALATGHYVSRKIVKKNPPNSQYIAEMHRAVNCSKDQSYFLFTTTQSQLDFLRFPLGEMTKEETRLEAKRLGLSIQDKPDSQDICFVPNGNYVQIVEKLRPEASTPGEIIHVDGRILGQHDGIINYTIGQRRGLRVAIGDPLYVVKLDAKKRRVIVGPKEMLDTSFFWITGVNWLGEKIPEQGLAVEVKLRSGQTPVEATIFPPQELGQNHTYTDKKDGDNVDNPNNKGEYKVVLQKPQEAVTPGQACVAYHGSHMLGGGWITGKHKNLQYVNY